MLATCDIYKIILECTHTLVKFTVMFEYQYVFKNRNIEAIEASVLKLSFCRCYYLRKDSVKLKEMSWLKKNIKKQVVQVAYVNDKNSNGHT